jgi:PAS domain S-box-containing protein
MSAKRLLIVEDSRTQAEQLRSLLDEAGYTVDVAYDGLQAIAALEVHPADAVLSDIVMPGEVDGFELCQRIKAGPHRDVPVVLLTSLSDPADIIQALECGADNFIRKPYEPSYLLERLRVLFTTRELRAKNRVSIGMTVLFMGHEITVDAGHQQVLDLLISTFEEAVLQNRQLRQSEEELRLAKAELDRYAGVLERRLQTVLETIPDALFSVDISLGNLFYVSPGARSVFGYAAEELIADPQLWRRSIHADDLKAVLDALGHAVESRQPQAVECRFQAPQGAWRWLQLKVAAVAEGPQAGVRLDGVARDITDQRHAEEELRRSEGEHRSMVEHAPLGIYRSTVEGRIVAVNQALVAMLGYESAEAVLGLSLPLDVYAIPEERNRIVKQFADQDSARAEVEWRRRDGTPITVRLNVRTVRDRSGGLGSFEGIVEDVTEQRSVEEQFRQAQKMEAVGRLAGGVAHDFNNVLTVITTDADLLLGDLAPDDPRRADVEEIRDAALSAAALTRQLLAFSRKQVLQPRVLNLTEVIAALEKMLRRLIGEDVTLAFALAPDLGSVRADPGQIEQVILNLAVNARDAMPSGGQLLITTSNVDLDAVYLNGHAEATPGRHVMIEVRDTGIGMDAATQARIFEPFFTTKEIGKGTGLGLATVYGIVKQSGGFLNVYSEPGLGTAFKIYFPRTDEPADTMDGAPGTQPPRGGHETVLVVEDDALLRKAAVAVLEKSGYRVLPAPDGHAALDLARELPGEIHLLLTDLIMPGMPGRALSEALVAIRPGVRVLFMSGYTDDTVLRNGVLEAGVAFLPKPFNASALARKVREVLDA